LRLPVAGAEMLTEAGAPLHITISIGVATLLKQADEALYIAKNSGRNQVRMAAETPPGGRENVLAAYECGHPLIDDQHRALFRHVNDFLAAILAGCPTDQVIKVIESMTDDIVKHFQCEEAIFAEIGFPSAMEHTTIHRQLVERAINRSGKSLSDG
jgi:hemerythrin-like metal-binding protein